MVLGAEEVAALKSFRNIPGVTVLEATAAGVADVIGHASLVVSQEALDVLSARAGDLSRGSSAGAIRGGRRARMDARQVIIEPVVSEKSYALMADGKYTFRVDERAHKTQIARAVEEIFEVRVRAVRTAKVRSKPKRRGLHSGRTRSWKKAVVAAGARATGSSCSRAPRWPNDERASDEQLIHADPKDQANQPGAALRDLPASRRAEQRSSRTSR